MDVIGVLLIWLIVKSATLSGSGQTTGFVCPNKKICGGKFCRDPPWFSARVAAAVAKATDRTFLSGS